MTSLRALLNRGLVGLQARLGQARPFPSGVVQLFEPGSMTNRASDSRVELFDLDSLFGVLGLSPEATSAWIDLHGISSEDTEGHPIIPEYPVFSKVAWMHIDEARVSGAEINALIDECLRGEANCEGLAIQRDFFLIRSLAREALALKAEMHFCHP